MRIVGLCLVLALPTPALAADVGLVLSSPDPEREPGVVVAVHGETYVVQLGEEPAVGEGTLLQVYRRLPSTRGGAGYRDVATWWEVGKLSVASVGEGLAMATQVAGPAVELPLLDESGAPPERVQIGDVVRTTGVVGKRGVRSRVVFPVPALFAPEGQAPSEDGLASLRRWAEGIRRIDGPIEIRVRTRLRELGVAPPDLHRSVSASRDAGEGPVPGDPVTPVMDLYGDSTGPLDLSPARSVRVVEADADGLDTWHYLDPVTLAHRRAAAVADVVAAATGIDRDAVLVTVVPLPELASHQDAPGYDQDGDSVWILSGELEWEEVPDTPPVTTPKEEDKTKRPTGRDRRPFERFPREVG